MDDNRLGRNIKHLREIHRETLEELGNVLHCAKSTVKGYENGSRKPDLQALQLLSIHYNKTVDELLYVDLTGIENISIDLNSSSSIIELMTKIFPLFSSDEAMKSDNFKKGYELSQKLLNGFDKGEVFSGNIIVRIFEAYLSAVDESETPEAIANLMWSIFVWWSQIYDINQIMYLQNRILSKKVNIKDYIKLRDAEDKSIREKRTGFVSDFDEVIISALRDLKSDAEWAELADYYLALRYVLCMVDDELPNEMNTAIGMQMMVSFMELGNSYAFTFCNTGFAKN